MSDALRVNTDQLRMTADQLDMHAADLRNEHTKAHTKLASTVPGFGAALSAAALNERLAQWEQETAEHHSELMQLSHVHRVAESLYTRTDSSSTVNITTAGASMDAAASRIDL
jgi:cell division protein ZapA (FtsZ GTPase activity inhibitor)